MSSSYALVLPFDDLFVLTALARTMGDDSLIPQIAVRHLGHVGIILDIQAAASLLGTHKREQDDVGIHGAHEDANDLAVVVAFDRFPILVQWFQWPV